MNKFIKRIQSRLTASEVTLEGRTIPMWMVRQYYEALVADRHNPTEAELAHVIEQIKTKLQEPEPEVTKLATAEPEATIPQPEVIEITPEESPDLWEILQPPVERPTPIAHAREPMAQSESNLILAKTESNPPAPQSTGCGVIAQSEVAGMVSELFTGQPPQLQQQITEYAMERVFNNIREAQTFLEKLRSTEFDLMIQTLQDHFNRRGSMIAVLDEVLTGQKKKDDEAGQVFFGNFKNRLAAFQQEMEARLSKTGI